MAHANPTTPSGGPSTRLLNRVSFFLGAADGNRPPAQAENAVKTEGAERSRHARQLWERSEQRIRNESTFHQENLEAITAMAYSFLGEGAAPEMIEDDWLSVFYGSARAISSKPTQLTWARVLAGQATKPGSFSKRSLAALQSMDLLDWESLAKIRRASVLFDKFILFIYEPKRRIYVENGIDFPTLLNLGETGLVTFTQLSERSAISTRGMRGCVEYFDEQLSLTLHPDQQLHTGPLALTRTGEELIPFCDAAPIPGFTSYIRSIWESQGANVSVLKHCTEAA